MKKIKYNNSGVTLIEVIIVLAIMGIVLQVVYSIFFVGNKTFTISKDRGFAQQDSRMIQTVINNELRTSIKISNDLNDIKDKVTDVNNIEKIKCFSLEIQDKQLIKREYNKNDWSSERKQTLANNVSKVVFKHNSVTELGFINIYTEILEGKKLETYKFNFDILLENLANYNEEIDGGIIYYLKYDD